MLDDLEARGLLDETLVVMLSEFGRTPKISELTPGAVPGRDHWPKVFPAVFAGAGVVGGQVIGKSDKIGAYPVSRSFGPPDLAATIYNALGVDPATELRDRLGRPLPALLGRGHDAALHDGADLIRCPSRPTSDPSPRRSTSCRSRPGAPQVRPRGDDRGHLRRVRLTVADAQGPDRRGLGRDPPERPVGLAELAALRGRHEA